VTKEADALTRPTHDAEIPKGTVSDVVRDEVRDVEQPEVEVEAVAAVPRVVAPTDTSSPTDALPEDDDSGVVVIDAYDLDPDTRPYQQVEGNGVQEDDEDDGRRKRWSLFRRGGKR
jgi:hypothetical protein